MASERSKMAMLVVALVWIGILGLFALALKWYWFPKQEQAQQITKQEQKKKVVDSTSAPTRYKNQVNLGLDSFSGYALLRTDEFADECGRNQIKVNLVPDKGNSADRLKQLQSGELQFAVFTLDSLITASAAIGDLPGTVIALIDETKGADAIVAHKSITNIDALNDPAMKFVVTGFSPSETFGRVVMSQFQMDSLPADPFIKVDGPLEVYNHYRGSRPSEKKVYILWQPYVSKILLNPDYHILTDSSKFSGYFVDALVVNRDYLVKNTDICRQIVEAYFKTNFHFRATMVEAVVEDSKGGDEPLNKDQAAIVVNGIRWKNTQENYAHFALIGSRQFPHIEDMLVKITNVLVKTKAIKTDPTGGAPNRLYYPKILEEMYANNFHPGAEELRNEKKLVVLNDQEWSNLMPVGTLQVPNLVYGRGTAKLTIVSEETLTGLVKDLEDFPQYYLIVIGHCRSEGNLEANKKLAEERATTVRDWLLQNGVDKDRVKVQTSVDSYSTSVSFVLGQTPY